jgi:plastocyanin
MAGSAYAPVIVGLAVGAAFVIILFSVSSSNSDATSDKVSIVTISDGPDPNFEPNVIRVVIGINNTVRWINEDSVPYTIASDTDYRDPYSGPFSTEGRAAEEGGAFVMPGQFF